MPSPTDVHYFHGCRADLDPPSSLGSAAEPVELTPDLDAAIWAAELAEGDGPPRVYRVTPTGPIEDLARRPDQVAPPHPWMSWRCAAPVLVDEEVRAWTHYHGTKAALVLGDLIAPGHVANFGSGAGSSPRAANFVYFTRTLDASIWGAELAVGDGPGRVYLVEPTGPYEDDPNLTNARFRGNPSKSFRSRAPLRVVGEHTGWRGHPPELVRAMRARLAELAAAGVEPDDG